MKKRYSKFIKPISLIAHLAILNGVLYYYFNTIGLRYAFYINFSWLFISYFTKFYNFHRLLKASKVVTRFLNQIAVFTLAYFAYINVFKINASIIFHAKVLILIYILIILFRVLFLYALKKYRIGGGNFRKVVVIGQNENMKNIIHFLNNKSEYGYRLLGYFSNNIPENKNNYLGNIEDAFSYILQEGVHELYCSTTELDQEQIKKFIHFSENNLIVFKLIPDDKDVFSKGMVLEYFDYTPVLSLRKLPFNKPIIKYFKRGFDIVFSLFVIVFILSWLIPIMFVFIKLDSKGSLFFKQKRDGINGNIFYCYKFRSMYTNKESDNIQVQKEDRRITKIGEFIRKTSIDEFPQFFNVLIGDMSVVGPRPHMLFHTEKYGKQIDKYMVRHFVKPGITGLAQARGYRGEIQNNKDMEDRIKLDIFYIENWSFFLDLKIILKTVLNLFRNEEKAY